MIHILEKMQVVKKTEIFNRISQEIPDMDIASIATHGMILDTRKINLDHYPYLRVISRVGVGLDNLDLEDCERRGIKVYNTPCHELTEAVSEFTLKLMLDILRQLPKRESLYEKQVGVIGYGRIGSDVCHIIDFMCRNGALVYDVRDDLYADLVSKEELLRYSDIITIHISGNEEVIGKEEFDMMKRGSYLINTAREGCVNHEALFEALSCGVLEGYATDVDDGLCYMGSVQHRVLQTNHIASSTYEARKAMENMAVDNLIKGLKGD